MVGFDAKNKDTIGLAFRCPICSFILRDPVQLTCGHRQCKSCAEYIVGETIRCPVCQEEKQKKDMLFDKGFKNDMQELSIICSLCAWNGPLKDYEDHLTTLHPNPTCEYCGKNFDSTNSFDLHKLNECDKITVPCALKDFGCSNSVVKVQMSEHYKNVQHQSAIMDLVRHFTFKSSSDQHERGSRMDIDTLPHPTTSSHDNVNEQVQEVYETIDILAGGIQTLNEDAQRLSTESLRLNNTMDILAQDSARLKLSIQEQNAFLDGLKPNQEILQQDVASLKQELEDMQFLSYDGTLTWKISNFKKKMEDAHSEQQTSIYSPPFYSSPTGYKMRSRLYLHGDGNARRTHMSLFFVLMRSKNDPILKFPFNSKVTFCLYDQTPAQRHVIDSFRPDIRSNSFQRPRSEMNIASGIPKFFPLTMIQQEGNPYVRDDTMFIKIMVDFGDLPKTLLPYTLSLNPGLPTNIQQAMIRQEAERRTQQTSTSTANITASEPLAQRNE